MMPVVDQSQLDQFESQGFVVVEDLLDIQEDIAPVIDEYSFLLDDLTEQLWVKDKIQFLHRDLPFDLRLVKVMAESGQQFSQHFDISLPQNGVTTETPMHHGKAVFNLLRSPRLLDAVECFIGPEIFCNPVQHTRIKIPEDLISFDHRNALTSTVDWHNDSGVILKEADQSSILTVWLPITNATEQNGCLELFPISHKRELPTHCPDAVRGLRIPSRFLPNTSRLIVPVKQGSVLFMHRKTVHRSLPNRSNGVRWSFDLRYNVIGQPTGRPFFPGFVVRSQKHTESMLSDSDVWAQLWRDSRDFLANKKDPTYNRWNGDVPACA